MKIDTGKLQKAKPKSGKAYPYLPDTYQEWAPQIDALIEQTQQLDALTGAVAITGSEVKGAVVQWFYDHFHGRSDIPSTVKVAGTEGNAVAVSLMNKYGAVSDDKATKLKALIGEDAFGEYFTEAVFISIDSTKIPAHQVQAFVDNLSAVADMFEAIDAISATTTWKVDPAFHASRHQKFSTEVNSAIHREFPCVVSLKTKGVTA